MDPGDLRHVLKPQWDLVVYSDVYVLVCTRRLLPANGVELCLQKLICPLFSSWEAWDPGTATGQYLCLNPAAAGIYTAHMCVYISPLTDFLPAQPERGGK